MLADDAELAPRPAERAARRGARRGAPARRRAARPRGAVLAIRRRELLRTAWPTSSAWPASQDRGEALTVVAGGHRRPPRWRPRSPRRSGQRRAAADPDRRDRDGPVRRPGDGLRQRRRRAVRARPAARRAATEAATRAAHAVAERLRALLARPGPDPALAVDAGLRPEGRQGPLVRTLASYRAYYRALVGALGGAGPAAGRRSRPATPSWAPRSSRWPTRSAIPTGGIGEDSVREIRRIKARIEAERMPRGVDPALQPQARARRAGRRGVGRPAAAAAARARGARAAHDRDAGRAAGGPRRRPGWRRGRRGADRGVAAGGADPGRGDAGARPRVGRAAVGGRPSWPSWPGCSATRRTAPSSSTEDWRRAARQARTVMERLFYG